MATLMRQLEMKLGERRKPAPYTGPDKSSKNGNRPLTFPTPYHGGKRRWADEILRAFGDEREAVYVEPFSGSAAVLLANERPYAREILCDTNPHIVNVFRALAWAPEVVAFWADWPTIHQDLTSRHTWLLRWAVENATEIETNPDFYDPKAAGWWLWGKSNWIGTEFGIVKGLTCTESDTEQADAAEYDAPPDKMPNIADQVGGKGISAQRQHPAQPPDKRPHVKSRGWSGDGVQAQRGGRGISTQGAAPPESGVKRPQAMHSGRGVSAQRADGTLPAPDKRLAVYHQWGGGSGVSAQRDDAGLPQSSGDIPFVRGDAYGRGVNAQRTTLPAAPPDKRPYVQSHGGIGIQAQRHDDTLPQVDGDFASQGAPDKRPQVGRSAAGQGVSALRKDDTLPAPQPPDKRPAIPGHGPIGIQAHSRELELEQWTTIDKWNPNKIPHIAQNHGGIGISAQREGIADEGPPDATHGARAGIGKARQMQQEVPYYLRQTPVPLTGDRLKPWFIALAQRLYRVIILNRGWQSGLTPTVLQQTRTARKPPVRVLLDPPYKGVGKLYGMSETEADALAVASWRWAAENGSRPDWRIAYACREGDFDDEAIALGWTCSKASIAANHRDATQEVVWFSPYCER